MQLTPEEQAMYDGKHGIAIEKSMEILVALGDIYGAENMVDITSAQISGVSYKTIGEAGLEYLDELAASGVKVKVPSTLNPAGIDLERWEDLKFSKQFVEKQNKIIAAYQKMGISTTCTCTPYLVGNVPIMGSHIAWSESSAVCYANSVLGARTNREGGPGALAAAICGKTAAYGYHLDEGRKAKYVFELEIPLKGVDYGALGYIVGKIVGGGVPYFKLKNIPSINELKSLGAALASSGAVALYHVEGVTPEYEEALKSEDMELIERISVTEDDVMDARKKLSTTAQKPDLICIGCPHASLDEIEKIAEKISGRKLSTPFWVCTSIPVKAAADRMGYTKTIENAGGKLICDTCMVVSPLKIWDSR